MKYFKKEGTNMTKAFLNPKGFAEQTGMTYQNVLHLCKTKEIETITTVNGRRFLIPNAELLKFKGGNSDFVSIEKYEEVVRENEKLKIILEQLRSVLNENSTGYQERKAI